jgi:(S)-2-hydroxyglutarate dehydrogenase
MDRKHLVIVGGGIVGLATAYKLGALLPSYRITVLEKEEAAGRHQTGHNSGVLHCGLYYKPGSIKARLAVSGIQEMVSFCQQHEIEHEVCGKIVVAVDDSEVDRLKALEIRGKENGLTGLRWLDQSAMREIEPNVGGVAALKVPQEGIVDYPQVTRSLVGEIEKAGNQVICGEEVTILQRREKQWLIQTPKNEYRADYIVGCAGLHSDRVSQLAGETRKVRIIPFRGEYYQIKPERQHLVNHLIYPVPDPQFPFLGVHFTRLIHGGIEAGPNAVLAFAREGYRKTDLNLADLIDAASFPGLWRFVAQYPKMTIDELRRSFSKKRFCESLQRLVPSIQIDDLAPGGAGVRAQAMSPGGTLIQDFEHVEREGALHVLNAPSPAATASLAIGGEIAERVKKNLKR